MSSPAAHSSSLSTDPLLEFRRRREWTLQIVQSVHDELRDELVEIDPIWTRARTALNNAQSRGKLQNWLGRHLETLGTAPAECFVDGLEKHIPETDREEMQRSRKKLLERLRASLTGGQEPSRLLLAATFGLVFMRFSPALGELYYHWLLCDVLPDKTRCDVMSTLAVPEGYGTVGWVVEAARLKSPEEREWPVALRSCFNDPKGRVATEDLVTGNRSWIGQPIFEGDELTGVLFAFSPLEGLFTQDSKPDDQVVAVFRKVFARHRRELLIALEADSATNLYDVPSTHASSTELHRDNSATEETGTQKSRRLWLQQMLMPGQGATHEEITDPADPLGFLLALEMWRVSAGDRTTPYTSVAVVREATFIGQLFNRLQLACLFPTQWAPEMAWRLKEIHDVYHDKGASRTGSLPSDPILLWTYRASDGTFSHGPVGLYSTKKSYQQAKRLFAALGNSFPEPTGHLASELKTGLELHSPAGHVADLLVPLWHSWSNQGGECYRIPGFLRIKCISAEQLGDESAAHSTKLSTLHDHFGAGFARVRDSIATVLTHFECCIRDSRQDKIEFEQLKLLLDLRVVFCDAVVWQITQALTGMKPAGVSRFELFSWAASLELDAISALSSADGASPGIERRESKWEIALDTCQRELGEFCKELQKKAKRSCLADSVVLVSAWLTRNHPVLDGFDLEDSTDAFTHIEADLYDGLFSADPGLPQLLQLSLRESFKDEMSIRYSIADNDNSPGRLNSSIFIPPMFYADLAGGHNKPFKEFECTTVDGDKPSMGRTTFRDESGNAIKLNWRWDRFPEPVSVHFVKGQINANLFRGLHGATNLRLTNAALSLEPHAIVNHHLKTLVEPDSSVGLGAEFLGELNRLACFLAGVDGAADERGTRNAPWRAASLNVADHQGILLALTHGQRHLQEEKTRSRLAILRDAALRRTQADLQAAFQQFTAQAKEAELLLRKKELERISWVRHLLYGTFAQTDSKLDKLFHIAGSESEHTYNALKSRLQCLECLIDCVTERSGGQLDTRRDIESMVTLIWAAYRDSLDLDDRPLGKSIYLGRFDRYDLPTARALFLGLANLIHNAVKFASNSRSGRIVNVTCDATQSDLVSVVIENSGGAIDRQLCAYIEGRRSDFPTELFPNRASNRPPQGILTFVSLWREHGLGTIAVETGAISAQIANGTRIALLVPRIAAGLKGTTDVAK